MGGAFTYAVSQTALIPAIRDLQAELDASAVGVTSLFTAFFVSGAVTVGIFGRLADMFGKRRIFVAQLLLFTIGSLVAALATSLPVLLTGRVISGCASGVFPIAYSIVRDELPSSRVPAVVAAIGGITGAGGAIGLVTGGLVADALGPHWIFWIGVICGALSVLAAFAYIPESAHRSFGRVDYVGAALLAGGLGAPLVAISQVPAWGWGGRPTLALVGIGVVLLAALALHERRHPDPLLHVATLRLPRVALTNVTTLFVGFGIFGASTILSQFVQEPVSTGFGFGASATEAGLYLMPGLILILLMSPVAGRLTLVAGAKVSLVVGTAISFVAMAGLALAHDRQFEMYLWPTLMYLGVAFTFAAAPMLILETVPADLRGQSTGVNLIMRSVGSSVGLQLAATLVVSSSAGSLLVTEAGFRNAFILETAGAAAAFVCALLIPRGERRGTREAAGAVGVPLAAAETV
jgi:EmrB/QacA subfamily drug resistance transporter